MTTKRQLEAEASTLRQAIAERNDQIFALRKDLEEARRALSEAPTGLTLNLLLDGRTLAVAIPRSPGHLYGHTIEIPATQAGITQLLRILEAQASGKPRTLRTEAAPTQGMVEAWLAAGGKVKRFDENGRPALDLEGLEL